MSVAFLEQQVSAFLKQWGKELDEDLVSYLAASVADEDGCDPQDLADIIAGHSEAFAELTEADQVDQISCFVCALREAAAAPEEPAAPAAPAPGGSGAVVAPDRFGGVPRDAPEGGECGEGADSGAEGRRGGGGEGASPQQEDGLDAEAVAFLLGVCSPGTEEGTVRYVLKVLSGGDSDAAAQWLLENDPLELQAHRARAAEDDAAEAEAERKRQEKERKMLREKYQVVKDQVDTGKGKGKGKGRVDVAMWAAKEEAPTQRYLDGQKVATKKGEKYVVVQTKEEWDGGSRGKVVSKGKRGKGFY